LQTPDNPMRFAAGEAIGLALYKSGDLSGAREAFQAILDDPQAPQNMRGRRAAYLAQLAAQGVSAPPAAEATAPVDDSEAAPATAAD
jgi:hypothetical protein